MGVGGEGGVARGQRRALGRPPCPPCPHHPPPLLPPGLTVKVIGRQWYWSYEMHDHLQQKLVDPDRLAAIAEKSILSR